MVKTYKAIGTQVSISLVVGGRPVRVSFYPVSNYEAGRGGSEFKTGNVDLQKAIESNAKFGSVFFILDKNGDLVTKVDEEEVQTETESAEDKKEVVNVTSLADAKNWLAENKGWEPTGRPRKKDIIEVAAAYGVVFDGI